MRYPSPRILYGSRLRLLNCHISKNKKISYLSSLVFRLSSSYCLLPTNDTLNLPLKIAIFARVKMVAS